MKTEKICAEKLLDLFLEKMKNCADFEFLGGIQPFGIRFSNKVYYVYIKNISSAYFTNRPDVTRAQLPKREEFDSIKNSEIPFIFLGYDSENDIYVCWNFHIAKNRLNEKDSVSFYSRYSIQNSVKEESFYRKRLSNGDNLVLFKREMIEKFFKNIDSFFDDADNKLKENNTIDYRDDKKISEIKDENLLEKLKPLLTGDVIHSLEAIKLVQEFYGSKYPDMTYKDWSEMVRNIKF